MLAGIRHETVPPTLRTTSRGARQCYDPQSCGSPLGSGEGYFMSGAGLSWTGTLIGTDRMPLDDARNGVTPACTFTGRWCTWRMEVEMAPALNCYAMTRGTRTDFGRPAASIRFRTATPMVASVCWAAKPRARRRGPISAL